MSQIENSTSSEGMHPFLREHLSQILLRNVLCRIANSRTLVCSSLFIELNSMFIFLLLRCMGRSYLVEYRISNPVFSSATAAYTPEPRPADASLSEPRGVLRVPFEFVFFYIFSIWVLNLLYLAFLPRFSPLFLPCRLSDAALLPPPGVGRESVQGWRRRGDAP